MKCFQMTSESAGERRLLCKFLKEVTGKYLKCTIRDRRDPVSVPIFPKRELIWRRRWSFVFFHRHCAPCCLFICSQPNHRMRTSRDSKASYSILKFWVFLALDTSRQYCLMFSFKQITSKLNVWIISNSSCAQFFQSQNCTKLSS